MAESSAEPANISVANGHEDLSSLKIGSELTITATLFGEKAETEEFTRELIRVLWRNNDPIDLYIVRPRHVVRPKPIIYLYSYPSETDRFRNDAFCSRVTQQGFAAIGFVSALTGQRYHDRPMKEWFVSELHESLVLSVHDVQMVLNYLATRGDLDMERVGMFGQGSGGTIGILAAAVDARIKVLDLLNPWGDWPDFLGQSARVPEEERSRYLTAQFLASVSSVDPVQWLAKLKVDDLRVQFVAEDLTVPKAAQERMTASVPGNATVLSFATTKQLYRSEDGGRLFDWIKTELERGPKDVAPANFQAQSAPLEPVK